MLEDVKTKAVLGVEAREDNRRVGGREGVSVAVAGEAYKDASCVTCEHVGGVSDVATACNFDDNLLGFGDDACAFTGSLFAVTK